MALVASKPSISGIWTSMRTTSNAFAASAATRFSSIVRQRHEMPAFFQQPGGQHLVHRIVLGQQDAQRRWGFPQRVARHEWNGLILDHVPEGAADRLEQLRADVIGLVR